jgi:hypothetical protein
MTQKESLNFLPFKESQIPAINADEKTRFQTTKVFGASFNEAGMIPLNSLPRFNSESITTFRWQI